MVEERRLHLSSQQLAVCLVSSYERAFGGEEGRAGAAEWEKNKSNPPFFFSLHFFFLLSLPSRLSHCW